MPAITSERTRPGLRMVEAHDLGPTLALLCPKDGGEVLVVVDQATPAPMLRQLARVLLWEGERRHLSRFLSGRRKR
jgi:hypothetical protein